eukprot:scaffold29938_cov118-Isochrysis_galbana.AAC.2
MTGNSKVRGRGLSCLRAACRRVPCRGSSAWSPRPPSSALRQEKRWRARADSLRVPCFAHRVCMSPGRATRWLEQVLYGWSRGRSPRTLFGRD